MKQLELCKHKSKAPIFRYKLMSKSFHKLILIYETLNPLLAAGKYTVYKKRQEFWAMSENQLFLSFTKNI